MAPESARLQTAGELASAGRQVWDAVSGWLGREPDAVEVTLLFTELCGFRSWILQVGDQRALGLLRQVASVVEPCITAHQGRLVKRLGHGHMAVFPSATSAVEAALAMQRAMAEPDGHPGLDGATTRGTPAAGAAASPEPRLRAGLHRGQARRLDGDYLGAAVNIAARIAGAARMGEVLVSGAVLDDLPAEQRERLEIQRRRSFRAKGAPPGLEVFCVASREQG